MNINFSIITVTYNSKKDLLKTIESIQSQTNNNFIHIIKDGLSNDKTDEIDFSKYRNTFYYRNKDIGIYDAMNQAVQYASNEYILYLNSGDIFFQKNSLRDLDKNIQENPNFNSYCGGTIQIDPNKKRINRIIGMSILYKYLPFAQLPHPSFVIKKSVLLKLNNPFDYSLKIASDYKQQLVLRKKKLWKNCYLNQIISIMPIGGISNKNKLSIVNGYLETLIFSFKLFNIQSIYILIIKILLNVYSKISSRKIKSKDINY